jgi:RPA family protein
MDSTYRLKHSVSVSAGTVKATCLSLRSENILIIDNTTVSLWNLERLTNAVHFVDLEFETEVVGLESLLHIDGYAAHLQSTDSSV